MAKIVFLHGKESTRGGTKPKFLSGAGHDVIEPESLKGSFADAMASAQAAVDEFKPDIIVGSSRGGALAMAINPRGARLVLVAPAWRMFGVAPSVPAGTTVLHCEDDDIVPIGDSLELAAAGADLETCGKSHRMSDIGALDALAIAAG